LHPASRVYLLIGTLSQRALISIYEDMAG
jgi:hypothetical protein